MRTTPIETSDGESSDGEKIGRVIATLVLGLAIAFGASLSAGDGDTFKRSAVAVTTRPATSAESPAQRPDPRPPASWSTRAHRLTYVVVDSEEVASALRALLGITGATMQQALGEASIVVVSTREQDAALSELIASANLELMAFGAFIEMIDLRGP